MHLLTNLKPTQYTLYCIMHSDDSTCISATPALDMSEVAVFV